MTDAMSYLETPATERRCPASTSSSSSSSWTIQNEAIASLASWLPKVPSLQPPPELAGASMTDAMRSKLARAIIADAAHEECCWSPSDRLVAFRALKELSRLSGSSGAMGSLACLKDLVGLARQEMVSIDQKQRASQTQSTPGARQQHQQSQSSPLQPAQLGEKGSEFARSIDHLRVSIPDSSLDDDLARPAKKSHASRQDYEALDTLLRVLNNVLLQHANCRLIFTPRDQADGVRMALDLLSTTKKAWPPHIVALGARLTFFSTLFENEANKWGVEACGLVEILAGQIDRLVTSSLLADELSAEGSSKESDDALSEVLKALFNICLYYPRLVDGAGPKSKASMGDKFHPALLPCLGPTLKVLTSLPHRSPSPLAPPLTHAINVLINYPVQPYRQTWIDPTKDPGMSPALPSAGASSLSAPKEKEKEKPSAAKRVATALFGRSSNSSSSSSAANASSSTMPPASSPVSTALSSSSSPPISPTSRGSGSSSKLYGKSSPVAATSQRGAAFGSNSRSRSSSGNSGFSTATLAHPPAILSSTLTLLEIFFQRYFSSMNFDEDDAVARAARDGPDLNLEEVCQPALILLRKLVAEDAEFRAFAKQRILPSTIDRTESLDKRKDFTGQLIRLMSSGTFPQLALLAGETLLALCDDNVERMSTEIGYGPCAGFFASTGRAAALPASSSSSAYVSSNGGAPVARPIDPITGKVMPSADEIARQDKESGWSDLTEEEKEAEAEKLFGLFDRMDRTGVVKAVNPVRQAQESGKMAELDRKLEEERRKEDEEDEREAEREMRMYKQRQAKGAAA